MREFGEPQWEWEIGEAPKAFNPEADLIAPSGENVAYHISNMNTAHLHKEGHSRAL